LFRTVLAAKPDRPATQKVTDYDAIGVPLAYGNFVNPNTYRYAVRGQLKLADARSIRLRHMNFEFETENALAKAISITSSISEDEWPRYERNNKTLHLNNHGMTFIEMEIRGLQNILSLFGDVEIDTENWEISFIPESDDEKLVLPVTRFKQETSRRAPVIIANLDHDTLTKAVAASLYAELFTINFPLSFFRKGRRSMKEGQFIGAFYEFYFVLETLYGNGKTKNYAIESEFKKSHLLRTAARDALEFSEANFADQKIRTEFVKKFQGLDEDSLIHYLVERRGFLHHHTARNRNAWHPAHEKDFEIDALIIQGITLQVLIEEVYALFESKEVKADLNRQTQLPRVGPG
jgi:hypothetical protein